MAASWGLDGNIKILFDQPHFAKRFLFFNLTA
jgi:hypothetical protein